MAKEFLCLCSHPKKDHEERVYDSRKYICFGCVIQLYRMYHEYGWKYNPVHEFKPDNLLYLESLV